MILQFKYFQQNPPWNLFHKPPTKRSFFRVSLLHCLPAFRACISHDIRGGTTILLWFDGWLRGRAPMHLWPDSFAITQHPFGMINDLAATYLSELREVDLSFDNFTSRLGSDTRDSKHWRLTSNEVRSVKSFYNFLVDGGLRCRTSLNIWKGLCPRKVKAFTWLAWDNKILTLENLTKRKCNRLPTAVYVFCFCRN